MVSNLAVPMANGVAISDAETPFLGNVVEGSVDYKGRPVTRSKSGGWRSASFIIGNTCLWFWNITNFSIYVVSKSGYLSASMFKKLCHPENMIFVSIYSKFSAVLATGLSHYWSFKSLSTSSCLFLTTDFCQLLHGFSIFLQKVCIWVVLKIAPS